MKGKENMKLIYTGELTPSGKEKVAQYIAEMSAKRKEIVDAGLDTTDDTTLPCETDILSDIEAFGEEDGYCNCWGVTDNYNADHALYLEKGVDYI